MKVQTDLKAGFLGLKLDLDLDLSVNIGGCHSSCGKNNYCQPKPRC
jgi:hypothetical protein